MYDDPVRAPFYCLHGYIALFRLSEWGTTALKIDETYSTRDVSQSSLEAAARPESVVCHGLYSTTR
jgi:hypothetical protein